MPDTFEAFQQAVRAEFDDGGAPVVWTSDEFRSEQSRFSERAVIVVAGVEVCEADSDLVRDDLLEGDDDELRRDAGEFALHRFATGVGRGASGTGIAYALLDGTAWLGGLYGGLQALEALARLVNRLRSRHDFVSLSHGALQSLCLFEVLRSDPALSLDELVPLPVTEVGGKGLPSELNHVGCDMSLVIIVNRTNTRSWSFLLAGDGKILHSSDGDGLPPFALMYLHLPAHVSLDLDASPDGRYAGGA